MRPTREQTISTTSGVIPFFSTVDIFMTFYREGAKKAKAHCGFDINHGILTQVYLTDGNGAERLFIDQILTEGQTGVMDRDYQSHDIFDLLQGKNKHFVCRIKSKTTRTIIEQYPTEKGSYIFYDALVLLDEINYATQGWSAYFHYQHSTKVMARVKWFTEERVRKHLCVRHKVRTRTNGYKRFSTDFLYNKLYLYTIPTYAK
ncbi:transposase [Desulfobacter postgatei]|uniref:Group II intron maturase family protein n=1 Tax=Desulfobacter postgatei 2ac9 TaxID=879212 RepID=I5B1Q2_9BACT|nr:transposase [Desulfobacter postgatei]EIM63415.1 group II intron maturase family protein [Desulfobacter postgatei 2ac9]